MNINSINPYHSVSYTKNTNTNSKTDFNTTNTFSIRQSTENEQVVKRQQANSSNTWEELSGKYDVRKGTFEEITEISQTLYEAGDISLKDHALLTFDYEKSINSLKQNATIPISANFDMYETSSNSSGERDWIAEFEARASKDFKYGNLIGYQNKMKILTILQRLDT
ncbi:hypothetical protein PGC35_19550 [Psychrobacillus sp. PGGUH221]|uniref:hypothetical protein n=1 Tax=Psychrobacillus sp. PGGUH221 TaxID=3020058 RepID=UPI0035C675D6